MSLELIICVFGFFIIGWHTWALKYHFDMPKAPPGVRVISTLVLLSAAFLSFLIFQFDQPQLPQWIGLAMLIVSFVLFLVTIRESRNAKLLAAFDEKLPHGLVKTGPYSVVRHPFYTSYIIQWAGWAIAAWNIWAIVPVVAMTATYYKAATDEEAKFASTPMAAEYAKFMKSTGRFFPKLFS